MGHLVVLEAARQLPQLRHLVDASSSSVYGLGHDFPLKEDGAVDQPTSLYAATTFIDDIVSGMVGALGRPPPPGPPCILNIGDNQGESVSHLVCLREREPGRPAVISIVPRPPVDVVETWASVGRIAALTG